ncbi:MAG: hypothetical protein IPM06_06695 [Rhizobiales bacterium]|nr:hypothetical protein [Hyphomicrobiales bacterium]
MLNLIWETLQLPFYTLWRDGAGSQIAYAVFHCTVGDVLIGFCVAAVCVLISVVSKARSDNIWPFTVCFIALALAYTVFSEWMNVEIRQTWQYSSLMPRIPPLGTGLTPLLQWIVVPALTTRIFASEIRRTVQTIRRRLRQG